MKHLFLIFIFAYTSVIGGKKEIPTKVSEAFYQKYNTAENVLWLNEKGRFVAYFEVQKEKKTASYRLDGSWVLTSTELDFSKGNECLKEKLRKEYPHYNLNTISLVETPDMRFYHIIISSTKDSKITILYLNMDCSILMEY